MKFDKEYLKSHLTTVSVKYDSKILASERISITTPSDANDVFISLWEDDIDMVERFYILLLNRANKVVGYSLLSIGGVSSTIVCKFRISQLALLSHSCGVVVAHNHPSGNLKPSDADIKVTRDIRDALKLLDITLIDHLVITREGYTSVLEYI